METCRRLPLLAACLPLLASAFLKVEDACAIFDKQGALGFGRQIRSSSTSFAWTSAGSQAGVYPTAAKDENGNYVRNAEMTYQTIADYRCDIAGYSSGAESFTPVQVGNAGQTMFHRLTSQIVRPINCHAKGMQSATLAFYVASPRFKVVHDVTCAGSRRRLRGAARKLSHLHL